MPRLAGVETEFTRAEFDKYGAPLLLLHGLWTAPRHWRVAASYLAHLGWNSYAPAWRAAATTWRELVALAEKAAGELDRPVVVGHDLGALAALQLRGARAAIGIAPVARGTHPLARGFSGRWARWRGAPLLPNERQARALLGLEPAQLEAESPAWLDELDGLELTPPRSSLPRLLIAGDADPCCAASEATAIARAVGAEISLRAGGRHDLLYGSSWQSVASEAHRWLVRQLGESVVLLRGDEDLRDD